MGSCCPSPGPGGLGGWSFAGSGSAGLAHAEVLEVVDLSFDFGTGSQESLGGGRLVGLASGSDAGLVAARASRPIDEEPLLRPGISRPAAHPTLHRELLETLLRGFG
jgi:hypothetical protein